MKDIRTISIFEKRLRMNVWVKVCLSVVAIPVLLILLITKDLPAEMKDIWLSDYR